MAPAAAAPASRSSRAPRGPADPRRRAAGGRWSATRRATSGGSSADAAARRACAGPNAPWPEPYPERRALVRLLGLVAQARDRLSDQARDVHLGDADARADLRLREVLLEPEPQDLALAVGQHA